MTLIVDLEEVEATTAAGSQSIVFDYN